MRNVATGRKTTMASMQPTTSQPASLPGTQAASQPANQPASQPAAEPASQPARQPGSQHTPFQPDPARPTRGHAVINQQPASSPAKQLGPGNKFYKDEISMRSVTMPRNLDAGNPVLQIQAIFPAISWVINFSNLFGLLSDQRIHKKFSDLLISPHNVRWAS